MRLAAFLYVWIVRRLPTLFILWFVFLMAAYLAIFVLLGTQAEKFVVAAAQFLWGQLLPGSFSNISPVFRTGFLGILVLGFLLLGILGSYNAAVLLYRKTSRPAGIAVTPPIEPTPGDGHRLDSFQKIGIILAGGGAKGAYQAGAMKAIYEFLEQNNALDKVKMIAGTSIGSWNSMFWLADLVKSPNGEPSVHERWWRSLSIKNLVEFDYYWPLQMNHFLKSTPWQNGFSQIFVEDPKVHEHMARLLATGSGGNAASNPPIHFYLTRSNVELGRLEFSTNWPGVKTLRRESVGPCKEKRMKLVVDPDRFELIDGPDSHAALLKMRRAVFASMDLPPLFPYMDVKVDRREWFEDGGVVDNLPVWFGTHVEECELLFILPLNASFAEPIDNKSIVKRLFRVMDVRQGVLERNSFKLAYLYNELAAAKNSQPASTPDAPSDAAGAQTGDRYMPLLKERVASRVHKPVSVFAICPDQPLAIGTAELWKGREAGEAFELMYAATKYELMEKFEELANPAWIRMVLVRPQGEKVYVDNF